MDSEFLLRPVLLGGLVQEQIMQEVVTDQRSAASAKRAQVALGLEFSTVFTVGLETSVNLCRSLC